MARREADRRRRARSEAWVVDPTGTVVHRVLHAKQYTLDDLARDRARRG